MSNSTPLTSLKAGYMVSGLVSEVCRNGVSITFHNISADVFYQHLRRRVRASVACEA